MATPPLITEISDTYPNPSDAVARVGFAKLYNYVKDLLGSTGNQTEALVAIGERTGATGTKTMPSGTTAQRSNSLGQRYNTTISEWEGYNGTAWYPLYPAPLNYIRGLNYYAGTATSIFSISDGQASCTQIPRIVMQAPGASTSKTMANWVVGTGNGGKSTAAAVASFTTYHIFMIRRPDTDVVDFCFSTNSSISASDYTTGGGNLPTAYTQSRRIMSIRTGSSATSWVPGFSTEGMYSYTYGETLTSLSTSTTPANTTLYVPNLPTVQAFIVGKFTSITIGNQVYITDKNASSGFTTSRYNAITQVVSVGASLVGSPVPTLNGAVYITSDSAGTLLYSTTGYYDYRT